MGELFLLFYIDSFLLFILFLFRLGSVRSECANKSQENVLHFNEENGVRTSVHPALESSCFWDSFFFLSLLS